MITDILRVFGALLLCLSLPPLCGGWFAVRLREDDNLHTFAAACLAGVTTLALVEMAAYTLRLPDWAPCCGILVVCLLSTRTLFRSGGLAWDALLVWTGSAAILISATLPFAVHGLECTRWDWYEHWLRTLVFLTRAPITTDIGRYSNAARGPLFNAASAQIMWFAGSRHYWVFQIVSIALNALVCLPTAILLKAVAGLSRRQALLTAAAICVVWPFFFWNNTFTWTKSLTAAFILMGIARYLLAWRKRDGGRMATSLAWIAPGFLTHYLALIYAAVLGLHLLFVKRRDLPIAALFRTAMVWGLLVPPWFGYLFLQFGVRSTLGANSTVGSYYASRDTHGNRIPYMRVLAVNLCADLLPEAVCTPLWSTVAPEECTVVDGQSSSITDTKVSCKPAVLMADRGIYGILGYSGTLALLLGTIGLLRTRRRTIDLPFLLWMLGAGLLLNLLPFRWFERIGTYFNNLQPWCLVLATLVVRGLLAFPRPVIAAAALGMLIEFVPHDLSLIRQQEKILPFAHYQSSLQGNPPLIMLPAPDASAPFHSGGDYYDNYRLKIQGGAVFFRDLHPDTFRNVSFVFLGLGLLACGAGVRMRRPESGHFG
uniref:Glycosyltransferase RgtA/B/C/D-like domain-containing protein n=1 Tax=Solibacter usitatus (strain Ellin6076) TaxID=234267 RepID=Q01NA2_SOLUE